MLIEFTKMQGLGNDYIFIDCMNNEYNELFNKIPKICDRHFGIGADGVILVETSKIADFKMRIFNSDGTEAQMCGNGIRCLGKLLYDKGYTNLTELKIETLCGIKKLKLDIENSQVKSIQVDMETPEFNAKNIPMKGENNTVKIVAIDKVFNLKCVSMGNPHAIAVIPNVDNINISKYGKVIENDTIFPEKTNVEFVEIIDKNNIKMRVWERGSGETLACGTGACASSVICNTQGYTDSEVTVHLLGGTLDIKWDKNNNHVYMKGTAQKAYDGIIEI